MPAAMKSTAHRASVAVQLVDRKLQSLVRLHAANPHDAKIPVMKKQLLSTVEKLYSRADGWKDGPASPRNEYWDSIDLLFFRLDGKSEFFSQLHREEENIFDRLVDKRFNPRQLTKPTPEKRME